jgi:hypothetical protein
MSANSKYKSCGYTICPKTKKRTEKGMLPAISLLLVIMMVVLLTYIRWENRAALNLWASVFCHIFFSAASGVAVWLVNLALLGELTDSLSILLLLALVGVGAGSVSALVMYGKRLWQVAPRRAENPLIDRDMPTPPKVVKYARYANEKKALPKGVRLEYDEQQGWTLPEDARAG